MKNLIEIKKIQQHPTDTGCEVVFDIAIREVPYQLKYCVHGDIQSVPERNDAVVVAFLTYAMQNKLDFVSEYPLSEQLYYNIKKHIIPALVYHNKNSASNINITMPLTKEKFNSEWNGTGVSLGVDSLATIREYGVDYPTESYKLTHLVHLKTGSHNVATYYDAEMEARLYASEHKLVTDFCDTYNYNLVTIETNLHEIINNEFTQYFSPACVTRNLGTLLLVQHRFNKYYYASSCNFEYYSGEYTLNMDKDMSHYEKWLLPLLSTENLTFYSANEAMARRDKIAYISDFDQSYDFLHVCWTSEKNCGYCAKCLRTLVQLDILDQLNKYKNSFDLDNYYLNRKKYIRTIAALAPINDYYAKMCKELKEKGEKMPNFFQVNWTRFSIFFKNLVNSDHAFVAKRIKRLFRKR